MRVALVRLREAGQLMTYKVDEGINVHDYVIVEADRGTDYGEVVDMSDIDITPRGEEQEDSFKSIIRKVSPEDTKAIKENKQVSRDAMKICARKIREYKLSMKLVDCEYSFDKKKIVFYFHSGVTVRVLVALGI